MNLFLLYSLVTGAPWTNENSPYNLNQNKIATGPLEYQANWPGHVYNPSPANYRVPFYSLMLDRFSDGDPSNNDNHKSLYENDPFQVNFNHGGDVKGLINRLDYLQSLGIKGIYLQGTPFLNQPWDYHQYNPIDLTLLDPHRGTVDEWRQLTTAIHARGMIVIIDLTVETLGDLTYFKGYLNQTAPLNLNGYPLIYKTDLEYQDFKINNTVRNDCKWPNFYDDITGLPVIVETPKQCFDDDFAHFGDVEAFGTFKGWERQLSKFSGVQDRLKDWNPTVADILVRLSCLTIEGLDIDGIRVDKATQMTLDFATKTWPTGIRTCAKKLGKANFFIPGEITSGIDFGSLYIGRGRLSSQRPKDVNTATNNPAADLFFRNEYGFDSEAFHYSMYRSFLSFMGLKGSIMSPNDLDWDPIIGWNQLLLSVDYFNVNTKKFDPRDMFGISNQDTFLWPSLEFGRERLYLGLFMTTLALPGIPLFNTGHEQMFYIHDSRSENYIYSRQPMTSSYAWQMHGCFRGSASYQFVDMPFSKKSRDGCLDDTQSRDHFNPVSESFLFVQNLNHIYNSYPIFSESFGLETLNRIPIDGESTYLWSVSRHFLQSQELGNQKAWLLFSNSKDHLTITDGCGEFPVNSPFPIGTVLIDVLLEGPPNIVVQGTAEGGSCLTNFVMSPFGFKAFLPVENILPSPLRLLNIEPGHDTSINIVFDNVQQFLFSLTFSSEINCQVLTQALVVKSFPPSQIVVNIKECPHLDESGKWITQITISGIVESIVHIELSGPAVAQSGYPTFVGAQWFYRFGSIFNVMAFPKDNQFAENLELDSQSSLNIIHSAIGAEKFRYSLDFDAHFTNWETYEPKTSLIHPLTSNSEDITVIVEVLIFNAVLE
jgi:alpha-1,3-glucan synthase